MYHLGINSSHFLFNIRIRDSQKDLYWLKKSDSEKKTLHVKNLTLSIAWVMPFPHCYFMKFFAVILNSRINFNRLN